MSEITNTTAYPLVTTLNSTDVVVVLSNSGTTLAQITMANLVNSVVALGSVMYVNGGMNTVTYRPIEVGGGDTTPLSMTSTGFQMNGMIGEGGATPIARQTVSGAKGGNAALGNLITALATRGDIADNTTA